MKKVIIIILCLAFAKANSQQTVYEKDINLHLALPFLKASDYGIHKEVTKTETVYYKSDSTGYEPAMLKVLLFNDNGLLDKDYTRIIGKYASETLYDYTYKNGKLDSLVKKASAVNFNMDVVYSHDEQGRISKETATGVYTNYTTSYEYDKDGRISRIHNKNKTGLEKMADYFYENGVLTRVEQTEYNNNKEKDASIKYIYYANGQPLFSFKDDATKVVYHEFELMTKGIEFGKEKAYSKVPELMKIYHKDPDNFTKYMRETYKDYESLVQISESKDVNFPDWTKRYKVDPYNSRMIFRKLYYKDGSSVGSTDYDTLFEMRVRR
ncbi:YD repeat-containing protein [Nonlabens dokdonensis]|nr:YD repeat-containing protein [Nonlabens dokdonensis]